MPNSESNSAEIGRYGWPRVRTNRHKTNKQRDISNEGLAGRLSLLKLETEELGDRFPVVSALIGVEIGLIESEMALRAKGKSKPTPVEAPEAPYEIEDFQSLALLEDTTMVNSVEEDY